MSVDIDWKTLTGDAEGVQLAEKIRAFVHERFQQVPLPRFIRSVKVHSFNFGDVPPVIEVKDICDPHPDFYDDEDDDAATNESSDASHSSEGESSLKPPMISNDQGRGHLSENRVGDEQKHRNRLDVDPKHQSQNLSRQHVYALNTTELPQSPLLSTSGIPGGTSNLTYFHLPYAPGLPGSSTPLAAVASGQFHNAWHDGPNHPQPAERPNHNHSASISSLTPSSSDPTSRPSSQHAHDQTTLHFVEQMSQVNDPQVLDSSPNRGSNDLQVVSHVKYSGNMSLVLTAEILLDYPMPSFVGVPFQLHITGFSFDGVSILAYAKKKVHFCFLSPEDANAFLGSEVHASVNQSQSALHHAGGLLEEIRVESEIGQKENGKQVLKNVGKVEKFILEQVRRIFEHEFVFPSFWTFLV
jgi:mitochondrial distribution and morphology protein 12